MKHRSISFDIRWICYAASQWTLFFSIKLLSIIFLVKSTTRVNLSLTCSISYFAEKNKKRARDEDIFSDASQWFGCLFFLHIPISITNNHHQCGGSRAEYNIINIDYLSDMKLNREYQAWRVQPVWTFRYFSSSSFFARFPFAGYKSIPINFKFSFSLLSSSPPWKNPKIWVSAESSRNKHSKINNTGMIQLQKKNTTTQRMNYW